MSYESPVNLFYQEELKMLDQIQKQADDAIMAAIRMNVTVEKDELIKALDYDRGQYEKGVNDVKSVLLEMCRCRHQVIRDNKVIVLCTNSIPAKECNCQCLLKGEQ